jgi:hypothetical protein
MPLTNKQVRALQMRREGKKLREIGVALDITPGSARRLIGRALRVERQLNWAEGLPSRYATMLLSRGINTLGRLQDAVSNGSLSRMPGIGPKSYETILEWLRGTDTGT